MGIFVPTIMAGGLLFTLLVLLRDLFNRLVGDRLIRHVASAVGAEVSSATITAKLDGVSGELPRRGRAAYAATSVVCLALAIYLLPGATFNYLRPDGYLSDIAWIWAVSLVSVVLFAALGALVAVATIRYHQLPPVLLPLLARTPLLRSRRSLRTDVVFVGSGRVRALVRFAQLWAGGVGGLLLFLAFNGRLPRSPEAGIMGRAIEQPIQLAVLVGLLIAVIVGAFKPMVAAVVLALTATILGVFASYEYRPRTAVLVTAAFAVPGIAFWLAGRRHLAMSGLAFVAVVTAALMTATVAGATSVYNRYFGPAAPQSRTAPQPIDRVNWAWVGAVTSESAVVKAGVRGNAREARLILDDNPALAQARPGTVSTPDRNGVVELRAGGLEADRQYFYSIEVDGVIDKHFRASFRTFPSGASSFRFAFSSCARTGSNSAAYDAIRESRPQLFLALGDLFYANIGADDPGRFRAAYSSTLTAPAFAALLREVPVSYVWDDHDYGANDADATSASRPAAMGTYRQMAPHYPLAGPESPLFQAFTVARVRFVMTDTRSARSPSSDPDGAAKTMLGAEQLVWLEEELRNASDYALVVWANPNPWIAAAKEGGDNWSGYTAERTRIADMISRHKVRNLVMISGDAHAMAADDGSHSDYSTAATGGFPVLHAAPIDRPASIKGGPYSEGYHAKAGQFAIVDVVDLGHRVRIEFSGRDSTGFEWLTYSKEFEVDNRTRSQ